MHSNYIPLMIASTVFCCYLVYKYFEMESDKRRNEDSVGRRPDSMPLDPEQLKKNRELVKKEREARRQAKIAEKQNKQDGNKDLKINEKPSKAVAKESPTKKSNKPMTSKEEKHKEHKQSKSEHSSSDKIESNFDRMVQYLKQLNIENPEMIVTNLEKLSLNENKVSQVVTIEEKQQSIPEKRQLSKAERRTIQEQQRANKAAKQNEKVPAKQSKKLNETGASKLERPAKEPSSLSRRTLTKKIQSAQQHRVKLFNHLYTDSQPYQLKFNDNIHPTIAQLGVQYSTGVVKGCNARGLAFMNAIKIVIKEYETPPQKEFSRSLEDVIKLYGAHLQYCRPLAVSVTNAMKFIQWQIRQLPKTDNDYEMKETLLDSIDTYVREQIDKAAESIRITVQNKISDGDVILTFGCSSVILNILMEATKSKRNFRVVIVDARPWHEGREMLRRLAANGIKSTCVLINAVGFIMPEVTKVLLGAHALLANGYVMSRVGTAQIALLAKSYNVPVLVCCETHKFSERVQTDAFVYNEIGDPYDLVKTEEESPSPLANWKSIPHLTPLNLYYDVTPPELVTAVVTEVAILPCTSVPVILREQILWS